VCKSSGRMGGSARRRAMPTDSSPRLLPIKDLPHGPSRR
jgi:hypothetical protein